MEEKISKKPCVVGEGSYNLCLIEKGTNRRFCYKNLAGFELFPAKNLNVEDINNAN